MDSPMTGRCTSNSPRTPLVFTKGAKLLYRAPAYLIYTDPNLSIETLVQVYLWPGELE